MCGRLAIYTDQPWITFLTKLNILQRNEVKTAGYNISPSNRIPCIFKYQNLTYYQGLEWGFASPFAKNKRPIINARAETLWQKPTFRPLMENNRCLILCNGFYEWKREPDKRRPFFFFNDEKGFLILAGLVNPAINKNWTSCVVTTAANEEMQSVHHRMPVILNEQQARTWLQSDSRIEIKELLLDKKSDLFSKKEVSSQVNNSRFNDKSCIENM